MHKIFELKGMEMEELQDLATKLDGCDEAILLCATLGSEIDRELMQAAVRGVEKQVMVQAVATSMLECYCDEIEAELLTEEEGYTEADALTAAFSSSVPTRTSRE